MKKLILSALVVLMAGPVFANDMVTTEQTDENAVDGQEMVVEEQQAGDQFDVEAMIEDSAHRRPGYGRRMFLCYSRDLLRRNYVARGWNQRRTAIASLRLCRNRAFIPASCRFVGCRVRWY